MTLPEANYALEELAREVINAGSLMATESYIQGLAGKMNPIAMADAMAKFSDAVERLANYAQPVIQMED